MPRPHTRVSLSLVVLCAVALSLWVTRQGPGLGLDSANYIAAARSLAQGDGVRARDGEPLTHYPPGYPVVLALSTAVGADPLHGARVIDAMLFALLVGVVGLVAWRASRSGWVALVAAGLVLTTPDLATLGGMAMSESLAIALGLAGLAGLAVARDDDDRRAFYGSALAIAGSILTRYAAGAFWLAGATLLVVWRRPRAALRWSVVVWLPVLAWLVRNRLVAATATHRELAWHPPPWAELHTALATLGGWLLVTPRLSALAAAAGVAALIGLGVVAVRERHPIARALALGALAYLLCLYLARTVADAVIPFDARLLSPAGVFLAALLPILAACHWPRAHWLVIVAVLLLAVKARQTVIWARVAARNGLELQHYSWRDSRTLAHLPSGGPLYVNWAAVPYLLRGRNVAELPRRLISSSWHPNPDYRAEVERMRSTGGWVVYLDTWATPAIFPTADQLREALPLTLVDSSADGRIYRIDGPADHGAGAAR
ncbi:MAG TPA: phospholipid carrier-dependent glycosyltransferase [Gemmatimonadaceae bacterium]|nr:phospholipid carrier-dependent glycosyltransferase [Gemmatimonadaceae bacterium]